MKKLSFLLAATLLFACCFAGAQTRGERLKKHVYYFAADSLKGRAAGSEDAAKAADYIRGQFEECGLKPFFEDWFMPFRNEGRDFKNVVGIFEGQDPALKDEYIVLGAHYDHLGVRKGQVYNGADDNASGTASIIEIARALGKEQLKRSVIIAAFDAEELGLLGSSALADSLKALGKDIKLMMSIDMVGWLEAGKTLKMNGVATIKGGKKILESQASAAGIEVSLKNFEKSLFTATDTEGFAKNGISTLAVTTGLKSPYHKPEDDADKIDYKGLDLVTGYLEGLTEEFASSDEFAPSGKLSFKHRQKSDTGFDFGPSVAWSRSSLNYPDSKISTDYVSGIEAGLSATLSMKEFYLSAQGLICRQGVNMVNEESVFGKPMRCKRDLVKVPVMLGIRTSRGSGFGGGSYVGFGAYYSYAFGFESSSQYGYNPNQWGLCWEVGARMYSLVIFCTSEYQKNSFYSGDAAPEAHERSTSLGLRWEF